MFSNKMIVHLPNLVHGIVEIMTCNRTDMGSKLTSSFH